MLFRTLAIADVAGDSQLSDRAIGKLQGNSMRFHAPPRALQRDDIELPAQPLSSQDAGVILSPHVQMFRRDQAECIRASHRSELGRLDHAQAGLVHVEEFAVRADDLDAFGGCFGNRALPRFTFAKLFFRPLSVRDVEKHACHLLGQTRFAQGELRPEQEPANFAARQQAAQFRFGEMVTTRCRLPRKFREPLALAGIIARPDLLERRPGIIGEVEQAVEFP